MEELCLTCDEEDCCGEDIVELEEFTEVDELDTEDDNSADAVPGLRDEADVEDSESGVGVVLATLAPSVPLRVDALRNVDALLGAASGEAEADIEADLGASCWRPSDLPMMVAEASERKCEAFSRSVLPAEDIC